MNTYIHTQEYLLWDFPGSPAVKTLNSKCRWPRLDPWLGN